MAVTLHWFLPTTGDSRTIVGVDERGGRSTHRTGGGMRPPDLDYLAQVARAAEHVGFTGVLTPVNTYCEDAWITTAALIRETRRLKFLVAFRPNALSPTLAAQMAASYQRLSGGRLLLNVVTGSDAAEQRRFGDWLEHDRRYERTDEFLSVLRGAWSGTPYDFTGEHFRVAGATVSSPPDPVPTVYFGGSSGPALDVAARHVDVYLTWGEPPSAVAEKVAAVRERAARLGRTLRFGIRLHVIARETADEAWAEAQRLLDALSDDEIRRAQESLSRGDSVGQQRMQALHGGRTDRLEVSPNLWAGVGLVRPGAGTALVGSHREVADRIEEYHSLGIDEFILSGYPHLEEAFRVGEGIIPELAARDLLADTPAHLSPR